MRENDRKLGLGAVRFRGGTDGAEAGSAVRDFTTDYTDFAEALIYLTQNLLGLRIPIGLSAWRGS